MKVMAKITKSDCMTIEQAMQEVECSRATLYNYMNFLGIQRQKFPFDRRAYVLKSDVERIKQFVDENRG
jgi:ACT domain-containing protein